MKIFTNLFFNCFIIFTFSLLPQATSANPLDNCEDRNTENALALVVTCPTDVTVNCGSQIPAVDVSSVSATTNPGCDPIVVTHVGDVVSNMICTGNFLVTRTYHVNDQCGNTFDCIQLISVIDNVSPAITCPPNLVLDCTQSTLPPSTGVATAIDNCSSTVTITYSDVIIPGICPSNYIIQRTFTATDVCANTSTCIQTISIYDNTPPTITCPQDVTVSCTSHVPPPDPASVITLDNCNGTTVVTLLNEVITNQTCANRYTLSRIYQAIDECGNYNTCVHVITVYDFNPPSITCPQNITVACANMVPPPDPATVNAVDNCGGPPTVTHLSDVTVSQICPNHFTVIRTYIAIDECGNSDQCIQLITVDDNVALVLPPNGFSIVPCLSDAQVVPVPPVVVTVCGDQITPVGPIVGPDPPCSGGKTYDWIYTDCAGNSLIWNYTYWVDTAIVVNFPADGGSTVPCVSDAQVAPVPPIVIDNCGNLVVPTGPVVSADPPCAGVKTYQWTYMDCTGASTIWTYTYTISPPSFVGPANTTATVACLSDIVTPVPPLVTNSCGDVLVPFGPVVSVDPPCSGTKTYSWTYMDCAGNTATYDHIVTITSNTTPPTITCPNDITVTCSGMVPLPDPTSVGATDDCSIPTVTHVSDAITNQTCADQYTISRTYMATDGCNNTALCTQLIVVFDNVPPIITCPPNITTNCPTPVFSATATDNCNSPVTITYSHPSGSIFPQGVTTVTVTATDACGNSSACTFTVTNYLGNLASYHLVFTNGTAGVDWQGPTKGYIGEVAVDGIQALEKTSGTLPYAGTIYTNNTTLGPWQNIVNANAGQASSSLNQTTLLTALESDLENAFTLINALPVTTGYNGVTPVSLHNTLNTLNSTAELFVINVKSGFTVTSKINITGDPEDVFILRWDTDMNFSNGYDGVVNFKNGGAIVPLGGLNASNFIHVAGDLKAGSGGTNPPLPYPQGPRTNDGTGALITGGSDFNGGGFYTGYWLTTGTPSISGSGQRYGKTSNLLSAIFVGGLYTKTTKITLTLGTSGVYVSPCTNQNTPLVAIPHFEIPTEDIPSHALILNAWPNPTNHEFTLEIEDGGDESTVITVFDILGSKVLQMENTGGGFIRLGEELNEGVYFINVRQGQKSNTIKMIKHDSKQ